MALQIAESKTTREGTELSSFYVRLEYTVLQCGTRITVEAYHYASKAAYQSGCSTICVNKKYTFDYDAATDGTIQAAAHSKVLDEWTTVEESTDEPEYEAENVSIVDVD